MFDYKMKVYKANDNDILLVFSTKFVRDFTFDTKLWTEAKKEKEETASHKGYKEIKH